MSRDPHENQAPPVAKDGFAPVVIAPTYNNAATLADIISRTVATGLPLIIVNDGATDATATVLREWVEATPDAHVTVLTHETNRGKAAALLTGFAAATQAGYTHAATIDTDGQLDPEQIASLFAIAERSPDALVLGSRSTEVSGMPRSNQVGWYLSGLALWLEIGVLIRDSQCGLRVYPLHVFEAVRCRSGRFGFEAEIIARAAWAGCSIEQTPVRCKYFDEGERVSHFRPVRDGVHGFLMHAYLTLRRLSPWPVRQIISRTGRPRQTPPNLTLADWLNPVAYWRQLRSSRLEQLIASGAFGIGTFMANMPLGGYQVLLGIYAARRLRVSLLPVLIGLLLFFSPLGPWLSRVAMGIGHFALHARWLDLDAIAATGATNWHILAQMPFAWPIGSVVVAFCCNWITIGILLVVFRFISLQNTAGDRTRGGDK